jgi:hypothetical protein
MILFLSMPSGLIEAMEKTREARIEGRNRGIDDDRAQAAGKTFL